MFGYVLPVKELLTDEQQADYKAVYCGVCKALGEEHGFLARMLLSYDFTFLALLLAEEGEARETCQTRCPARFGRKVCACQTSRRFVAVADYCIILSYQKLCDDIQDESLLKGVPSRILRRLFQKAYRKASARQQEYDALVRRELDNLQQLEACAPASLDRPADAFAQILKGAARELTQTGHRRVTEQILYHLGRWIYLIDAWDDLPADRKRRRYNPLIARFGLRAEEEQAYFQETLLHSRDQIAGAYQLWNFGADAPLIEAVIFGGLQTVETLVLDRKWNTRRFANERPL